MSGRRWSMIEGDAAAEALLAGELGVAPLVARLLVNRGIKTAEQAHVFLGGPLSSLEDPMLMRDMGKAAQRILAARERGEKIVVYGDYDVDGVTASAMLTRFLRAVGAKADYYVPERAREGYGVNPGALSAIASGGAGLVITVDCGISDFEAAGHAGKIGLDMIITDHHQPPDRLPPALATLNPHRKDCPYPYKNLAGVGVAFKLIMAVRGELHRRGVEKERLPNLKSYLDLVAIGSVADCVPLTGENRVMTKSGLRVLSTTDKPGLAALRDIVLRSGGGVTSRDVGFGLAPALNAAGRLGRANVSVDLLLSENRRGVSKMAGYLDRENRRRREIQNEIFEEAREMVETSVDLDNDRAVVLWSETWHPGVVGIAAARIVDAYNLPAVLICLENGVGRGSARSVPSFDITGGLSECGRLLERFGGHEMAAGFTILRENLCAFREKFLSTAKNTLKNKSLKPALRVDCQADPRRFDRGLAEAVLALEPFGIGAPEPLFLGRGVSFSSVTRMGADGGHVRISIDGPASLIGFSMAGLVDRFNEAGVSSYDIVYTPEINRWGSSERVQLRLLDIRPHQP